MQATTPVSCDKNDYPHQPYNVKLSSYIVAIKVTTRLRCHGHADIEDTWAGKQSRAAHTNTKSLVLL